MNVLTELIMRYTSRKFWLAAVAIYVIATYPLTDIQIVAITALAGIVILMEGLADNREREITAARGDKMGILDETEVK